MLFWDQGMKAMQAWGGEYAMAYSQMLMSANEVIWRRTTQMATGTMTQPEATGMVLEKVTAMAKATEKASVAAAKGATPPLAIMNAALAPYGTKTRSNARRLRK